MRTVVPPLPVDSHAVVEVRGSCPDCAYPLQGLPPGQEVCPECGAGLDPRTVVLYGYARGSLSHIGNAPLWALAWYSVPALGWFLFLLALSLRDGKGLP